MLVWWGRGASIKLAMDGDALALAYRGADGRGGVPVRIEALCDTGGDRGRGSMVAERMGS
jgi:hypothetical protein